MLDNGFPGMMVWNMIADDVEGVCDGITKYPLMKAVVKTISDYQLNVHKFDIFG